MPPDNQTELTGLAGTGHVLSTVPAQRGEVLSVDLKPAYTSLGLPPSTFTAEVQGARSGPILDAAVGGGTTYEGIVWIFMGEDYLRLDMRTNTLPGPVGVDVGPTPIAAVHIKEALLAELKAMLDHRKRPVTVLKDVGGGRVAFDPDSRPRTCCSIRTARPVGPSPCAE